MFRKLSYLISVYHDMFFIILLAFLLGLYSTDERKHMAFGLLNLANFIQDDVLQFYPFTCQWKNFIFLCGFRKF
jgi:hypothetical protein